MEVDDAVNDAKVRRVWNASHNKFIDSDGNIYSIDSEGNETIVDRFTRDSEKSGVVREIYSQDGRRKIDGDGNVLTNTTEPGYWGEWTWSDGNDYTMSMMIYHNQAYGWYIAIDQDTYASIFYETEEECQDVLANSSHIDWYSSSDYERTTVVLTSSREWIEGDERWQIVDELALKSDIPTPGISATECRSIVQSYGYQTAT